MVFACLDYLECDVIQTNLLVIVDGSNALFVEVRNRVAQTKFSDKLCVRFTDVENMKNYDLLNRRHRIAKIHNQVKEFIKQTEYVFCVEDDTSYSSNTLKKLLEDYRRYPQAGLIQGVQIGRHGINHYGAWTVDNLKQPTKICSQTRNHNLKESDAGGLYCVLTKAENYLAHDFKAYYDALGPDFNYGLDLRNQGYKNYTDWELFCEHYGEREILLSSSRTQQVCFNKEEKRWRQKIM